MTNLETVHTLPGFLGEPEDWAFLTSSLAPSMVHHAYPHFYKDFQMPDFWTWAQQFNKKISSPSVFLGYSLGARLGLHALLEQPNCWKGAILVSCHPGLTNEEERTQRLKNDQQWAERFLHDPWDQVMKEWNAQPVFASGGFQFQRKEKTFSRAMQASILHTWSLAKQQNLRGQLAELDIPILWIVGENDNKFVKIATELKWKHPSSKVWIAPQTSHRVPWETPLEFKNQINYFLQKQS